MIAVTGVTGQLGAAFLRAIPDAVGLNRQALDLSLPETVSEALETLEVSTLINCGAYTAVDAAETDEAAARAVNAESVGIMAAWAKRRNVKLVTYSTDYVFDGRAQQPYVESDEPNPASAYGRTKLRGEELALGNNEETLIIRTAWVLSGSHRSFISTILGLVREKPISVVNDQRGCPTFVDDLAAHTLRLLDLDATGIVHATNQGSTTWFGLARAAVELAGMDPSRVSPCSTDEFPRPAPRPANSQLHSERYVEVAKMPPWEHSLPEAVDQILSWI